MNMLLLPIGVLAIIVCQVLFIWWFIGTEGFGLGRANLTPILGSTGITVFLLAVSFFGIGCYIIWKYSGFVLLLVAFAVGFVIKDWIFYRIFKGDIHSALTWFTRNPEHMQIVLNSRSSQAVAIDYLFKHFHSQFLKSETRE